MLKRYGCFWSAVILVVAMVTGCGEKDIAEVPKDGTETSLVDDENAVEKLETVPESNQEAEEMDVEDCAIVWKNPQIEEEVRSKLHIYEGDVMLSDVWYIREIKLSIWQGPLDDLANFPNLEILDLSGCGIENLDGLSGLKHLTELNLSNSQNLSDISGLTDVPGLTVLNLESTNVTDLSGLPELSNLITLNLANTRITDLSGLSNLPSLTALDLSNCRNLSNLNGISVLKSLETLALSGNTFTGVGLEMLQELPNLTVLNMYCYQMFDISSLSGLANLREFTLGGYNMPDEFSFPELPSLETLILISRVHSVDFLPELPNLRRLEIQNEDFSKAFEWSSLSGMQGLTSLSVTATIENLDDLPFLPALETFELHSGQSWNSTFSTVSDFKVLSNIPNVQELVMSGVTIKDLPLLENLKKLDIGECSYTWWNEEKEVYEHTSDISASLPNVEELVISGGEGDGFQKLSIISNMAQLSTLTIDGRYGLGRGDFQALSGMDKLNTLNMQYVSFGGERGWTNVDVLGNLPNVTVLNLDECILQDQSILSVLKNLKELSLVLCRVEDQGITIGARGLERLTLRGNDGLCDISGLEGLNELKELDVRLSKQVEHIDMPSELSNLESLRLTLELSNRPENLNFLANYKKLTSLYLDLNAGWERESDAMFYKVGISDVDIGALRNLNNLTSLELRGCRAYVNDQNVDTLSGLTNLTMLNLQNSYGLTDVSILAGLENLETLNLSGTGVRDLSPVSFVDNLQRW